MTRKTFKDPAVQEQFARDGYVVVPTFDAEQVQAILDVAGRDVTAYFDYFLTVLGKPEEDHKKFEVNDKLKAVVAEALLSPLDAYRFIMATFVSKEGDPSIPPHIHQDFALTDESRFVSVGGWCCLMETTEDDGCFCMVRESHLKVDCFRGTSAEGVTRYDLDYPAMFPDERLEALTIPVATKPGDVIYFDHRMVHFTKHNFSGKKRINVITGLVPDEAPLLHYHRITETDVDVYPIGNDFLIRGPLRGRPEGEKVATVPYRFTSSY